MTLKLKIQFVFAALTESTMSLLDAFIDISKYTLVFIQDYINDEGPISARV